MASYEPSFFTQTFKNAVAAGADPIDRMVEISGDPKTLPTGLRGVNLRMIAGQRRGEEGKYAMNLYLRQRGDLPGARPFLFDGFAPASFRLGPRAERGARGAGLHPG